MYLIICTLPYNRYSKERGSIEGDAISALMHKFKCIQQSPYYEEGKQIGVSGIGASWLRSDLLSILSQSVMAVLSDVTVPGECFCHSDAQADPLFQAF